MTSNTGVTVSTTYKWPTAHCVLYLNPSLQSHTALSLPTAQNQKPKLSKIKQCSKTPHLQRWACSKSVSRNAPPPRVLFLLQCLGDYTRDVGQSKMCSEDTRWCFGGGALGTDGKQEAGSLRMNLDDSQPRNENHPHPREVVQIPGGVSHCYGLNLQFPLRLLI